MPQPAIFTFVLVSWGTVGGALLGAFGECVVGVSEARVVQTPYVTLPSPRKFLFLCGVTPFREHYTPSELVQCSLIGVARCECR